jgi:hypothetical protein
MMSMNMLTETAEDYNFTAADFDEWAMEAGFTRTHSMALTGPTSAVIAVK